MTDPLKVLLVDDSDLVRTTLRRVLERAGHEARLAESLEEARAALAGWSPDCVVLDQRLPDGEGLAFADELRSQPNRRGVRIVLVSGDPLPDEGRAIDAFLLKPAGARAVLSAIEGTARDLT